MTEEPNHLPEQSGDQSAQRLYDLGAALVESQRGSVYCLTIIGQVEGHSVADQPLPLPFWIWRNG